MAFKTTVSGHRETNGVDKSVNAIHGDAGTARLIWERSLLARILGVTALVLGLVLWSGSSSSANNIVSLNSAYVILVSDGTGLFTLDPESGAQNLIGSDTAILPIFLAISDREVNDSGMLPENVKITPGFYFYAGIMSSAHDKLIYVEIDCFDGPNCGSSVQSRVYQIDLNSGMRSLVLSQHALSREIPDIHRFVPKPIAWHEETNTLFLEMVGLSLETRNGGIWSYELDKAQLQPVELGDGGYNGRLWLSPDNKYLLTTGTNEPISGNEIASVASSTSVVKLIDVATGVVSVLANAPVGQSYYYVRGWIQPGQLPQLELNPPLESSAPLSVPEATSGFQRPFSNSIYGYEWLDWTGSVYHPADDYNGPGGGNTDCNSDIFAVANGQVRYANTGSWGGIVIEHLWQGTTVYSQYGHIAHSHVSVNDNVTKGQHIAEMGNVATTYCHLHWEIREADHPNPTNGAYWSGLGTQSNVENWYEDPEWWADNHGPYGGCSNPNSDQITLYVRTGFDSGGQCITKGIGEYPNPGSIGLPNDSIRSIKVGGNVRARLCQDDNFNGSCQWFESDNGDLNGTSVGYGTSSVKVESKPPPDCNPNADQVALYVRTGFDNNGQCVKKGIGEYPNPGSIGLPNDSIRSIKVGGNVRARLCQDDNFNGSCQWFESDNGDLNGTSVGYGTSSVKVEARPQKPDTPSLANPANGAVFNRNDGVTLSWNSAARASQYYAEVWGGPNVSNNSGWISGTNWPLGQMWGGAYQWKVRARNSAGESDWSETRSFTVKYGSPSGLSATAASGSQINLSWNASADAPGNIDGYRIYRGGTAIATVGSSTTTYQNTGLACGTSYSYVVKAYKGNAESDASNTVTTTTSSCGAGTPSLLNPPNGAVIGRNDSVTLSWSASSNATHYYAEVSGGPNVSNNSGWTSNTSWGLGQMWGGSYQWKVKAKNGTSESGWSETRSFTVKYGSPSGLSATAASGSQINLSWSASADAPGNIEGYRIYRGGTAIATVGSSTTTYQNIGLACETTYSYVVKAYKGNAESDASNSAEATPGSCVPSVPADFRVTETTSDTVSLAWSDTNNESGYKLYRWDVQNEHWDFYFYDTLSANVTEFTDIDLNCDAHYFYEISAYNGSGESSHTGWIDGVTTACLSDVPTLVAPVDGAILNQADSVTLSWNEAEHAYDYFAEIWSADNGFPWNSGWTAETTWSVGQLDSGTYYWHVLSGNGAGGISDWSETRSFTVEETPTCQPGPDGIILYQGTDYTGRCITLTGDTDDLAYVSFDDAVSSFQFVGTYANAGWQIGLFADSNYGGAYNNFSRNDPDLSNDLGNGQASSFRIWRDSDDNRRVFLGQPVNGTIHVPNDSDGYWFYGTAGQRVTIKMNKQAAGLDAYLMLYGPNWGLVARDDDSGGDNNALILDTQLWSTGTHYVYARSDAGQSAGAYTLQVQCSPGANGIVLYEGISHTGRCVTLTGDAASLTTLSFNDAVSSIKFVGSYANAGWQAALFADSNYSGATKNFSGNDANLSNDIGNRVASSFRLWRDGDDGRSLAMGQTLNGTIHVSNDSDGYWFYGTAGQRITIAMNKQAAGLDPFLILYGPYWGIVALDDDGGGDRNALIYNVQLWATGVHHLYARSFAGQSAGGYTVTLSPGQ